MSQIIVDSLEPEGDDIMYLLPSKINSSKFLSSNIFDQATIQNCPTEKISSGGLLGIFNSLKPTAKIMIYVNQPIAIMLPYDAKQIEANLKLVGFESIDTKDTTIQDGNNKKVPTILITAKKPVSKRGDSQVVLEVKTTTYKNVPTTNTNDNSNKRKYNVTSTTTETKTTTEPASTGYGRRRYNQTTTTETKNTEEPKKEEGGRKRYNVTTTTEITTTTTTTTDNQYQPRGHKSYVRRYNKEEKPAEAEDAPVQSRQKLTESIENATKEYKPRGHKTYKREVVTSTEEKPEIGGRYYRRQVKITSGTEEGQ